MLVDQLYDKWYFSIFKKKKKNYVLQNLTHHIVLDNGINNNIYGLFNRVIE